MKLRQADADALASAEDAAQAAIDGEAGDLFTEDVGREFFASTSSVFGNRYKYTLSPRIAISYPVTDKDNLFFNYGHFSQWPRFAYVYGQLPTLAGTATVLAAMVGVIGAAVGAAPVG